MLIKRDWSNTEVLNLEKGKCKSCGYKLPGIFK
jgi:hypothetical protein